MTHMHLNPLTGDLQPGRTRCTVDDLEAHYVKADRFKASTVREPLLRQWLYSVDVLRDVVGHVCAAWIGGSFLTNKVNPGDIDSVYIVEDSVVSAACANDPQRQQLIAAFANCQLKQVGLPIDSFVLSWRVNPATHPRDEHDENYLGARGYWDDFWQRRRSGPKGAIPVRADALPLKGYLEVILDGFPQ